MKTIAETERFMIREYKPEDEQTYLALFEDPVVIIHLPKRTPEEHATIFRNSFDDYASDDHIGRWGIFNKQDDDFIGMCLLRYYDGDTQRVELGYALHQPYWGKGIAGEMAKLLVAYARKHFKGKQVVGVTTLPNYPSQKVLLKAGLVQQDNVIRHGEELAYFSLDV